MAKRKWNQRQNDKKNYPPWEPCCKRDDVFVSYELMFNMCLTHGKDNSVCEFFCLKNRRTNNTFDLRKFYKEIYLKPNGGNGRNGYKKHLPYCSKHSYDIWKWKVVRKCLICGRNKTLCRSFYMEDLTDNKLIDPRVFYKPEFLAQKV